MISNIIIKIIRIINVVKHLIFLVFFHVVAPLFYLFVLLIFLHSVISGNNSAHHIHSTNHSYLSLNRYFIPLSGAPVIIECISSIIYPMDIDC